MISRTTNLDILSERGAESARQEEIAAKIYEHKYPFVSYVSTPKDKPCVVDAILSTEKKVIAVVECKCRQSTKEEFETRFRNEWLVTKRKIDDAIDFAEKLYVPMVGFLYLIPSKVLLVKKIFDPDVGFTCNIRHEKTRTQATINGGIALRENSFIDMTGAKVLAG